MNVRNKLIFLISLVAISYNFTFAAEGLFEFSSRSASLALKPDSRVRLKYTDDGRQFGWSHASIVKTSGDTPQNWREDYPDGVVITYDDAPMADFDLTYTLSLFVVQNSNAIVYMNENGGEFAVQNSNAIVNLQEDIIEDSNAIVNLEEAVVNNSDAIVNNSSIIATVAITHNSMAIVTLAYNPFDNPVSGDLNLDRSRFMNPDEQVIIADNATIDGQGSVLYFAGKDKPVGPQFVVSPGKTVTLNNIKLVGLVSDTFSMMSDSSQIIIGENVVWGLDEHLTFTRGKISITGQNVWNIQGLGGQKRLKFSPSDSVNLAMINLGLGTLALQNIELTGLEYISYSTLGGITGALGLVGNTSVNVEKSTSMVFYIESLSNVFRLLENNLTFNGLLNYSETGDNALHFDFVLRSPVESTDAKAQLQSGKVPVVNFATNFIYLTSLNGIARIIFDDAIVKVNNSSDAFIVLENSYLAANKLQVSGDPIWDASDNSAKNRFAVEATELEAVGFTSEIVPEFGIPIIVDPGHHRSISFNSLLTRYPTEKKLLKLLTKIDRPKTAIEIK